MSSIAPGSGGGVGAMILAPSGAQEVASCISQQLIYCAIYRHRLYGPLLCLHQFINRIVEAHENYKTTGK